MPRPHAPTAPGRLAERLGGRAAADVAAAAALGGLLAAAMIALGPPAPAAGLLLPPAAALLTLLRPRLGYLRATLGLAAWLALAAGRPGAALVLVVLTLPPALCSCGDCDARLRLPAAAPALGALGLAPAYPGCSPACRPHLARPGHARRRPGSPGWRSPRSSSAAICSSVPRSSPHAGWQESAAAAVTELLVPLFTDPRLLAALAAWVLAALAAGVLFSPLRLHVLPRRPAPREAGGRHPRPPPAPVGPRGGRRAALS